MNYASQLRSVTATTSFVSLEALEAKRVSILNKTGADLDIQMEGDVDTGHTITLADGLSVVLSTVRTAAEIQIKSASGTTGVYVVIDN
jgi:hypothetical protein